MKRWIGFLVCLFLAGAGMPWPSHAEEGGPPVVVGRVYDIEGDLLRYIPDEKDWVAVVNDAPFGVEDTLYSGSTGRAELLVPNGALIRTGNSTQIEFIALDPDLTQADVAIGMGRFYNNGAADSVLKVTSPFGDVLAYSGAVFDFYVGENSVEVVALKGKVSFLHAETGARYDVTAGSPSILADNRQVSSGEGVVDPDWDQWNSARDHFWDEKSRSGGRSAEYLPPDLRDESYALEENGRWDDVYYDGGNRRFWRPTGVGVGWSPFTVGRWTDWDGDQTWIPDEPFGYVTHHYGNWIYANNFWYWAPPVVSVRVGLPLLDIGYYWYPGRVSWIYSGAYVGWIPLAPREPYYCRRHWGGPHTVVVNNININRFNIRVRDYAFVNHAVVVDRNNFYGVNDYRKHRLKDINRNMVINNYHGAPIINNTVIKGYSKIRQRYNYSNQTVNRKPHNAVTDRIRRNQAVVREDRYEKASVVRERARKIPEGRINRNARIEAPRGRDYIVPAGEVNRPKSKLNLPEKEIRTRGGSRLRETPEKRQERVPPEQGVSRERVRQPERPQRPGRPQQIEPQAPAPSGKALKRPERGISRERVRPPEVQQRQEQVMPREQRSRERVRPPEVQQRQEQVIPREQRSRERVRPPEVQQRQEQVIPREQRSRERVRPPEVQQRQEQVMPREQRSRERVRPPEVQQRQEQVIPREQRSRERVRPPEVQQPAAPVKQERKKKSGKPEKTEEAPAENPDGQQGAPENQRRPGSSWRFR